MNLVNMERTKKASFFNSAIDYENRQYDFNLKFKPVLCDEPNDPNTPSLKFKSELYIKDLKSSNPYF